jgi:uncharacterized repeat protein (TIGR01451 family)
MSSRRNLFARVASRFLLTTAILVAVLAGAAAIFSASEPMKVSAATQCQCVDYVKAYFGITDPTGNAKDMGTYFAAHGWSSVSSPTPGAVIILQPTFQDKNGWYVDPTNGHVGIIKSVSPGPQGYWAVNMRSANYGGTETELGCNDVGNSFDLNPTLKPLTYRTNDTSVSYWVANTPPTPPVAPLVTTKTADAATVNPGASDGYTITVQNPNADPETANTIVDTLPGGFSYTAGSTTGVTTSDPSISSQTLTWSGPFTVPATSSINLHFDVAVSTVQGTYFNNATATAAGVDVSPTGDTAPITVTNPPPTLTVPGDQTVDFNDPLTFGVSCSDTDGDTLLLSAVGLASGLTFTDNGNGSGTVAGAPQVAPGTYPVTFSCNDGFNPAVTGSLNIIVNTEEAAVSSSTSLLLIAANRSATLSAVLTDPDGGAPISGEQVTITLGTGSSSQSCTATTDILGIASCVLSSVSVPLGPQPVSDNFAGDTFYKPATNAQNALVFAYLSRGSFVIGDKNATVGNSVTLFVNPLNVTWWTAQWWKLNQLSGGTAPAAFKGFANTLSSNPPKCGGTYTANTGNSSGPPASVPSYMAVLVSSRITQAGSIVSGNIPEIVIVKTNAGYGPDPGHMGTGTVVAVLCKG